MKSTKDSELMKQNLICIGVDGKVDNQTLITGNVTIGGEEKQTQSVGKEHHLTFTCKSGEEMGKYLTHYPYCRLLRRNNG